jgi:3-oxoacyl-[acyl-carrier protein] reductase
VFSFDGKMVWITGSSTGIGRAAALEFAKLGADVIVHGNSNAEKAAEVVAEIENMGRKAILVTGHVGRSADVNRMVSEIAERSDRIDILMNNAGSMIKRARLEQLDEELWDEVMNVNFKSVYLVTKAALPLIKKSTKGRIINVTSVAARNGGGFGSIAYAASKGGVSTLTRGLAKDLVEYGITVNAISPGIIATPFHDRFTPPDIRSKAVTSIPMGREGTSEETIGAAIYLASDYADYVTGEIIEINGGQLMD